MVGFLAQQILGIVESQLKIERIFLGWNTYQFIEMLLSN